MLAVGTKDFIKLYDLSEDTISPTHNLMIFNGFINDFTFGKYSIDPIDLNKLKSSIYIASQDGNVYY